MNPDDVIKVLQAIREMATEPAQATVAMAARAVYAQGLVDLGVGVIFLLASLIMAGVALMGRKKAEWKDGNGWAMAIVAMIASITLLAPVGIGLIGRAIPQLVASEFYGLLKLLGK